MKKVLFIIICVLLIGCRSSQISLAPVIEFTKIPPAAEGGPDNLEIIEGRVVGSRPGQKIILFAKSGTWWVQPFSNRPITDIQPDSQWKSTTHLGTEYAALLVEPSYHPPTKTDVLPAIGNGVIAVSTMKGEAVQFPTTKTIQFSGYEWRVRDTKSDRGGKMTVFNSENVWTDEKGFLHLKISKKDDQWTCAEVRLTRSLGYGSYNFVIRDVAQLEPAAVLSIFTWDDLESGQNHREMDIEITRWGDPANKNMQYVVQPYYLPANVVKFDIPPGHLTNSIRWEPGRASFKTIPGTELNNHSRSSAEHVFTSGVPAPEGESIHLNLYAFGYAKKPLEKEMEVVIEKFEFLP